MRSRTLAIIVGSLALGACSGSTRREAHVSQVTVARDGLALGLLIDACNGDNDAEVLESPASVTVTITTDDEPGGDDCADIVWIGLQDPFGTKTFIDGSTGEAVESTAST